MKSKFSYFVLILFIVSFSSCKDYSPKPKGYPHFEFPEPNYQVLNQFQKFDFFISAQSKILNSRDSLNYQWFDIRYPALEATIHCSYIPVSKKNFYQMNEESRNFVYFHIRKAEQFQELEFENSNADVYGLVYKIHGNVASPIQFVLTDSIQSFFRAALYFDKVPNRDSIAPVIEYIDKDIQTIIESFRWKI
ncbi:gliding motility lipoprotein GldD [Bacteroidales bacterium OttesenSCG-928-A17]|nr:gliding motility lipoprotein GldD [Bacteroidales bacterium OttesenSCG-928-A17]